MTGKIKLKIALNAAADIMVGIYILRLLNYNKILEEIQSVYDNKILQAWKVVGEPDFLYYLVGGAVSALALIAISLFDYRIRDEMGVKIVVVHIVIHVIVLIWLLVVYSNPIFTTFVTVLASAGIALAALGD